MGAFQSLAQRCDNGKERIVVPKLTQVNIDRSSAHLFFEFLCSFGLCFIDILVLIDKDHLPALCILNIKTVNLSPISRVCCVLINTGIDSEFRPFGNLSRESQAAQIGIR